MSLYYFSEIKNTKIVSEIFENEQFIHAKISNIQMSKGFLR